MGLQQLRIEAFRCLEAVEFAPHPERNVIAGPNAAGKTSILEAIYFLGRGRSFRASQTDLLIQNGARAFTIFGESQQDGVRHRLGVRCAGAGLEIHIDGQGGSVSDLASALPVQVIDPAVQQLVQGGPQIRRRFLDWGVFHVKHGFLDAWRRYRRALQQRNVALRQGAAPAAIQAWNAELIAAGLQVDQYRREYLHTLEPRLDQYSQRLTGLAAQAEYWPGWSSGNTLEQALDASWERDRSVGSTQVGPHRAEIKLIVGDQPARHRLSAGQQKLLGGAMVLAQNDYVTEVAERPAILLVDEPAAELDDDHLHKLIATLLDSTSQLFLTALRPTALPLDAPHQTFHVKHGEVVALV